jgi:hypothetical protein
VKASRRSATRSAAEHDDVGPPVRQLLIDPHLGGAADHSRVRRLLLAAGRRDAEPPIAREAIRQQLPVAGLEDMQRKRRAGKENNREGEDGEAHDG